MDAYTPLLARTRVPQPPLQRFAVIQIFQKLNSNLNSSDLNAAEREAITQCLHSSSIAVVDQSVRELCRFVKHSHHQFGVSFALLELQSALEGCNSRFVNVFVKGIGFLVRFGFRNNFFSSKSFVDAPENHPFVKVLTCRSEVYNELVQQVVLFVMHGKKCVIAEVCNYLRPLLTYTVVQACSSGSSLSSFLSLVIYSLMSICCSLLHEATPLLEMLIDCLSCFNLKGADDLGNVIMTAEFIVDAYTVVLGHSVKMGLMINEVQSAGVTLLNALLTLCLEFEKHSIESRPALELTRRLLMFEKELGLHYAPQIFSTMLSLVILLAQLELEDEKLCVLDLLTILLRWRIQDENVEAHDACNMSEVSLFLFPIISLMSSPSNAVKRAASQFLSMLEKLLVSHSATLRDGQFVQRGSLAVGKPEIIILRRLLQHLWHEDLSPCSFFLKIYSACANDDIMESGISGSKSWIFELGKYALSVGERRKSCDSISSSQEVMSTEIPFLLGALVGSLVVHESLGSYAVETLATLSNMEPKLGVALLSSVLYYCNLSRSHMKCCNDLLLKLLKMLSALSSNSSMLPLILQTILPMLQKSSNPILFATALRLLCKVWEMNDRVFGSLHSFLLPECFVEFGSEKTIAISLAASLRDVCRNNPGRGVQLIPSVAACVESTISAIRALGFQCLGYLCEADVIDFYTAWSVIAKQSEEYSTDPIIAYSLCLVLRWGAMDAEAYPETSVIIIQILWNIGSSKFCTGNPLWKKGRVTAFEALKCFEVLQIERSIPEFRDKAANLLIHETDIDTLKVLGELETKIIAYEHSTRQRFVKTSKAPRSKIEKLLHVFPRICSSGKSYSATTMPGTSLFLFQSNLKDSKGKLKSPDDVFAEYHSMLKEVAASLNLSRNIVIALLSLQSLKTIMKNWLNDYTSVLDLNASFTHLDRKAKAPNNILKCMIKVAEESIPRVAENIALAMAAFCMILPASAHPVKVTALKFLLNWLFQYEHEHRQWSAAIAVGVISSYLHSTDRQQKLECVNGLLEVVWDSKNTFVKGACGIGLGYSCQDLLTRIVAADSASDQGSFILQEKALLGKIVRIISLTIGKLTKISSELLASLSEFKVPGLESDIDMTSASMLKSYEDVEDDAWGVTGLVLGLGLSVSALSRAGSYDAVCNIKSLLTSWVKQADSALMESTSGCQRANMMLSIGACLALPSVVSFCRRVEMMHDNELNELLFFYENLMSKLLLQKTPNIFLPNLLLASCVGAGSLLACVLDEGLVSLDVQWVKNFLGIFKEVCACTYPHLVHFGAFLGIVNAMGADTGITFHHSSPKPVTIALCENTESSHINAPLLSSSCFAKDLLVLVQDIFLVAQDSSDSQLQAYASWAIAFLHHHLWSNDANDESASPTPVGQNFSTNSTILKLSSWLMQLDFSTNPSHVNTVAAVLRCLSSAPRLPQLDWGAMVRRCMKYASQFTEFLPQHSSPANGSLLKECLVFSLAHANKFDQLLSLLDELTSLFRFRTLDLITQSCLLFHLSDITRIFSSSRTRILFEDLYEFFSSPIYSYQNYNARQKRLLQFSFWKGLSKCFIEASDTSEYCSGIEKCMEILFTLLPAHSSGANSEQERMPCLVWNESMLCFGKARRTWLLNHLQVSADDIVSSDERFEVSLKKMQAICQLVKLGSLPLTELAKLKPYMLNTRSQGLWELFVEVTAVLQAQDGSMKRQWLVDVLEISCITNYPSTALRFLGLFSGCFCKFMPFLILDPEHVLVDLPATLSSLFSCTKWRLVADVAVSHLWTLTLRIYNWAKTLEYDNDLPSLDIHPSEADRSELLVQVLLDSCRNLKEFLPQKNQVLLANMAVC